MDKHTLLSDGVKFSVQEKALCHVSPALMSIYDPDDKKAFYQPFMIAEQNKPDY